MDRLSISTPTKQGNESIAGSDYQTALLNALPYAGIGGVSLAALLGILKSLQKPNVRDEKIPKDISVKLPVPVEVAPVKTAADTGLMARLADHVQSSFMGGSVPPDQIFHPAHPNFWITAPAVVAAFLGSTYGAGKLLGSDKTEDELELDRVRNQFRRALTQPMTSEKTANERDDIDISIEFIDRCFDKCAFNLADFSQTSKNIGLLALIAAAVAGAKSGYSDEKDFRQRTIEEAIRATTVRSPAALSAELVPTDEKPDKKFKPIDITMAGTYKKADFMSFGRDAIRQYVLNSLSDPQFVGTMAEKVFDNPAVISKLTSKLMGSMGKMFTNPDTRRAMIDQGWNALKGEFPVLGNIADIASGIGSMAKDVSSNAASPINAKALFSQGWRAATGLVDSGAADKLFGGSGTAVPPGGAASGGGAAAASSSVTPSPIKT